MSREILIHRVDEFNKGLTIMADEPGPGGASHEYRISWQDHYGHLQGFDIRFQRGGVKEQVSGHVNGHNGGSNEALLAVVFDRLQGFQGGQFPHAANQEAMEHVSQAIDALKARSKEREARGVEGTPQT